MKILVLNEGFFDNLKNKAKQFSSKVKDKLALSKKNIFYVHFKTIREFKKFSRKRKY